MATCDNIDNMLSRNVAGKPKVLLTETSRWQCVVRMALALTDMGFAVSAVFPRKAHPLRKTRAVDQSFEYSPLRPLESLRKAIELTRPDLIIPCDDRAVQHLQELYACSRNLGVAGNLVADAIERSLGAPESHRIVGSRYELLNVARELDIPVPEMAPVASTGDIQSWCAREPLPCVLKADRSWGGCGVRIADTAASAETSFLQLFRKPTFLRAVKRLTINRDPFYLRPWWRQFQAPVLVQRHISGKPANCAVVCWEGNVLAGICVEVVASPSETDPATVVRVIHSPEMLFAARQLAGRLRLSGFFGLDFMIEHGTGTPYLIEMNPRCTPLCHLQLGRDRDLVSALWAQLSGQPLPDIPPVTENAIIAYFPQALLASTGFPASAYLDMPRGAPGLAAEFLRPWPERTLLFRAFNALSKHSFRVPVRSGWGAANASTDEV